MKKLLSILAISSLTITIGSNLTSCFLFPKKESIYDAVVNKIKNSKYDLTWKNDEFGKDGKVDLSAESDFKPGKSELPEVWIDLLTDLFDLQSNTSPTKSELHYITAISSTDNILEKDTPEEVKITVAKYPSKPTSTSETITKKITWTTSKPSDTELVQEVTNEINSKTNIYALGVNLDYDTSNVLTKNSIMDNIGLTDEQKIITTLSGTLTENNPESINFDIKSGTVEASLDKDVTWYKQSPTFIDKYSESTSLINGYIYSGSRNNGLYRSEDGVIFEKVDKGTLTTQRCNVTYQTKDGNVYLGTRYNGLYKSTDGGNNFDQVDAANLGGLDITKIFEASNGYIYLGTGSNNNDGLYISKDDGANFSKMDNSLKNREIRSIDEDKDGNIYISTDSGIYQSAKGSDEFNELASSTFGSINTVMKIIDDNLYVGTKYKGLWKSTDYENFTRIDGTEFDGQNIISIFKASNNNLYVGTQTKGAYESADEKTFTRIIGSPTDELSNFQEYKNTLLLSYDIDFGGTESKGLWYYYLPRK